MVRKLLMIVLRLGLALAAGLVLLAACGLTYESIADVSARRAHPPRGDLVDVGGYRLHLVASGQPQGLPTLVLEHGGGGLSAQWGWIEPELARHTQVVVYDRPGLGWSDPPPPGTDALLLAADLRAALRAQGIDGPYVVAGHSLGGMLARVFAHAHTDEVVGLALIDPRDIEEHELLPFGLHPAALGLVQALGRLGVLRLTGAAARDAEGLPPEHAAEAAALAASHRHMRGLASEGILADSAAAVLRGEEQLGDMPLLVLGATEPDGAFNAEQRQVLDAQHQRLAQRSAHGIYQTVPGAGHVTIVTHETPASVVASEILAFLRDIAAAQP
jgi:pimeloyl-ACP methyl ester carboxylesterase